MTTLLAGDAGDAAPRDAIDGDATASQFPAAVYDGLWLIGWSGGLDHYEWSRFTPLAGGTSGSWSAAGARCDSTCDCRTSPCPGRGGTFTVSTPNTLVLSLAADAGGQAVGDYRFTSFQSVAGTGLFAGATMRADVEIGGSPFEGFRFPSVRCGPDLTTCAPLTP